MCSVRCSDCLSCHAYPLPMPCMLPLPRTPPPCTHSLLCMLPAIHPPAMHTRVPYTPPPVDRMTYPRENITFPQPSFDQLPLRTVNVDWYLNSWHVKRRNKTILNRVCQEFSTFCPRGFWWQLINNWSWRRMKVLFNGQEQLHCANLCLTFCTHWTSKNGVA